MKRTFFLYLISIALFTSCTTLPTTPAVAPASPPLQTPAGTPASAPIQTPAGTPASAPIQTSAGTPASAPIQTSAGTRASAPIQTSAATPASAPIQTSENYGLYTDADLQIYANVVDQRIQEALKNNNTGPAQELGLKRQELIAEFNRRGLKRKTVQPTRHYRYSRHVHRTVVHRIVPGLPGEE
jgi:hypothetical protein